MSEIVFEVEAQHVVGVFGSNLGVYGYLPNNPAIARVPISSTCDLQGHQKYLNEQNIPYKINGQPYNGASW